MLSKFKSWITKKMIKSPMENVARLKKEAKKLGVDDKNLTTNMGGIETKHHGLDSRVTEANNNRNSRNMRRWMGLTAITATITTTINIISILK